MKVPSKQALLRIAVKSLTNNVGLKTFALLAAVVLFSLVHSEEEARRSVMIDVVALLPPPRSARLLVSELPDQIKITLKGSRSRIRAIQREDFLPVQMNLTDGVSHYFYFDPADIEVPAGVYVVQVEPAAVQLTWANAADKTVPVRARLSGHLAKGLEIRPPVTTTPPEVTLRGPESELKSTSEVYAASIAMDGLGPGKYERLVPLEPLPRNVKCLPEMVVKVRFEIAAEIGERIIHNLKVTATGPGKPNFRPAKVSATMRGPVYLMPQLDEAKLVAVVDTSKVAAGNAAQPQPVAMRGVPEGFEVLQISPPNVAVSYQRSAGTTSKQ